MKKLNFMQTDYKEAECFGFNTLLVAPKVINMCQGHIIEKKSRNTFPGDLTRSQPGFKFLLLFPCVFRHSLPVFFINLN